MKLSYAARRIGGSATALAAGALLALAGSAQAALYTPADSAEFEAAVAASNASVGIDDTIQLTVGITYAPTAAVVVADDLIIRGQPTNQANLSPNVILQGGAIPPGNDFFTVQDGVTLTVQGLQTQTGGDSEHPFFHLFGNLVLENSTISGANGEGIQTDIASVSSPSVTILNSTIQGNQRAGVFITGNATLSMNQTTVMNNNLGGVVLEGAGANIRNSIIAVNPIFQCIGGTPGLSQYEVNYVTDTDVLNAGDGGDCAIYDADGTNNITAPANTSASVGVATLFGTNGGPTRTRALTASSPSRNSGDNAVCPTIDQRYFVRTDGLCDRGAFELNAVRDTTPPACGISDVRLGPPKQQDVTTTDAESGMEAFFDIAITNGTVNVPAFSRGTRSGVILTATKTDQLQSTRWSFTARDWAGNVQDCR